MVGGSAETAAGNVSAGTFFVYHAGACVQAARALIQLLAGRVQRLP